VTADTNALLDDETLRRLEQLEVASRRLARGRLKGERRSPRRGQSSEFADYRPYVEGDDIRHLDWNLYARLDRLFLRLFLEEEDLHVHLLVDASASMGFGSPAKILFARRIAAAVGYVGLCGLDRVQIHAFAGGLGQRSAPLRGKRSVRELFSFLGRLAPDGQTSLSAAAKAFAHRASRGRGVLLVISDFLDPEGYEAGLKPLLGRGFDLCLLQILSPEELRPDLAGDLRLVDSEDGSIQEITVTRPLLHRYAETLRTFSEGLRTFCRVRGLSFASASTDEPFDRIVLDSLRRAGMFR